MARLKKRVQRFLIPLHRYLGIALSLVMLAWFLSGGVMVFHGYPAYGLQERLADRPDLSLDAIRLSPAEAGATLGLKQPLAAVRVTEVGIGPRMHLRTEDGGWHSVHADTGTPVAPLDRDAARQRARAFADAPVGRATRLTEPDQWTFSGRLAAFYPLWRITFDDDAGSVIYLSESTGEAVHRTDRRARVWGYAGAVIHWVYFTELRQSSGVWRQLVMWLAGLGCLMCLSGIVLGLWAWRTRARRRRAGGSVSPYRGWYRWHHLLGLAFGLVVFTWLFSGLLSLDPFRWAANSPDQTSPRAWVAGGALPTPPTQSLASMTVHCDWPRDVRLVEWQPIAGENGYRLYTASGDTTWASHQGACAVQRLSESRARSILAARPGHALTDLKKLNDYDAYYYPRRSNRIADKPPRLPVYRARYDDGSWAYLDPSRAEIVATFSRPQRLERWLYRGLHDLEFPSLAPGSKLWHAVIFIALTGGTLLSTTSVWLAWRRLRPNNR